mgnify:FL=1
MRLRDPGSLKIAQGEALGAEFDDVVPHGHAIEVRLYAEDPFRRFQPSPGRIQWLRLPQGPGVRNDSGVYGGSEISIHYDPMIAKLIVWGRDRDEALRRLARALDEIRIVGIKSNVPLFEALLRNDDFRAARFDIHWLDRKLESGELTASRSDEVPEVAVIAAAIAHFERAQRLVGRPLEGPGHRGNWRAAARQHALRKGGGS